MVPIPQTDDLEEEDDIEFLDHPSHNHETIHQTETSHAEQLHMRQKIRSWKRIVNTASVSLLIISCIVITIYFQTNLLDKYKKPPSDSSSLSDAEQGALSEACRTAKSHMDSYDACVDGCEPYLCCFDEEMEEEDQRHACPKEIECANYDMCAELQAIITQQIDWPLEVAAACEDDKEDQLCTELCSNAECCFELGESSCLEGREDFCGMYAPCEELKKGPGMFGIGVGPVVISKSSNP